jgi:hypothetical protein
LFDSLSAGFSEAVQVFLRIGNGLNNPEQGEYMKRYLASLIAVCVVSTLCRFALAQTDNVSGEQSVFLQEEYGKTFNAPDASESDVSVSAPAHEPSCIPLPVAVKADAGHRSLQLLSWMSIGMGGVFLITGGVVGKYALELNDDLREKCAPDGCYASEYDRMDQRDALASASTVVILGGAALVVAGVVMLLVDHRRYRAKGAISTRIGPSGIGLKGSF